MKKAILLLILLVTSSCGGLVGHVSYEEVTVDGGQYYATMEDWTDVGDSKKRYLDYEGKVLYKNYQPLSYAEFHDWPSVKDKIFSPSVKNYFDNYFLPIAKKACAPEGVQKLRGPIIDDTHPLKESPPWLEIDYKCIIKH